MDAVTGRPRRLAPARTAMGVRHRGQAAGRRGEAEGERRPAAGRGRALQDGRGGGGCHCDAPHGRSRELSPQTSDAEGE